MNKTQNKLMLAVVLLQMSCTQKIKEPILRSYSIVQSSLSGTNANRVDSTVIYIKEDPFIIDSTKKFYYVMGKWEMEKAQSLNRAMDLDSAHLVPFNDTFRILEILNINASKEDFCRLQRFANSIEHEENRVKFTFKDISENILNGYHSSAEIKHARQLLNATYFHSDSLLFKVEFILSSGECEFQNFAYNNGRIEYIRREWILDDSVTYSKEYKVHWNY
jgi:hypothetical protein